MPNYQLHDNFKLLQCLCSGAHKAEKEDEDNVKKVEKDEEEWKAEEQDKKNDEDAKKQEIKS